MRECARHVTADHAGQPQDQKDDRQCIKHGPPLMVLAIRRPSSPWTHGNVTNQFTATGQGQARPLRWPPQPFNSISRCSSLRAQVPNSGSSNTHVSNLLSGDLRKARRSYVLPAGGGTRQTSCSIFVRDLRGGNRFLVGLRQEVIADPLGAISVSPLDSAIPVALANP